MSMHKIGLMVVLNELVATSWEWDMEKCIAHILCIAMMN